MYADAKTIRCCHAILRIAPIPSLAEDRWPWGRAFEARYAEGSCFVARGIDLDSTTKPPQKYPRKKCRVRVQPPHPEWPTHSNLGLPIATDRRAFPGKDIPTTPGKETWRAIPNGRIASNTQ